MSGRAQSCPYKSIAWRQFSDSERARARIRWSARVLNCHCANPKRFKLSPSPLERFPFRSRSVPYILPRVSPRCSRFFKAVSSSLFWVGSVLVDRCGGIGKLFFFFLVDLLVVLLSVALAFWLCGVLFSSSVQIWGSASKVSTFEQPLGLASSSYGESLLVNLLPLIAVVIS